MRAETTARIGCSGWQYKHWKGDFYPSDLAPREWLEYYARQLDTVEVNNSFYRLPNEGTFDNWRARTPRRFLFAVKASRYLTHMKKLKDPEDPLRRLFERAGELRSKLGPVLYQVPRQLEKNIDRLRGFLEALRQYPRVRHAIEFRHPSWYDGEVVEMLRRANVAMCLHDMAGSVAPRDVTANFLYVRFHGEHARYAGKYRRETLEAWSEWIRWTGRPAFVYFNNDIGGHAPRDAIALRDLLCH